MFKDQAAGADFSTNLCQDTHLFQPGKGTLTWKRIILMTHIICRTLPPTTTFAGKKKDIEPDINANGPLPAHISAGKNMQLHNMFIYVYMLYYYMCI